MFPNLNTSFNTPSSKCVSLNAQLMTRLRLTDVRGWVRRSFRKVLDIFVNFDYMK